jgi:excisionase family DNA binding protein
MSTYATPRRLVLTIPEAAERAGVDEATVRRAIHAGELRAVRLAPGGRLLRVWPSDLAAWLGEPEEETDGAT